MGAPRRNSCTSGFGINLPQAGHSLPACFNTCHLPCACLAKQSRRCSPKGNTLQENGFPALTTGSAALFRRTGQGNWRAEGRRRYALSCSVFQNRRVDGDRDADSCRLGGSSSDCCTCHGGRTADGGEGAVAAAVLQAYDRTALYVGGHLGYAGGRSNWRSPPISPARSACSSPPIFSTGRAATSGGCKSATTTCCRTASCSVPSSTPRFRAFQISTASPSAASRSSLRRRAAWRAIARRCFTPAPCAVASVTLPATGCSMRPAASPGPTTSWR